MTRAVPAVLALLTFVGFVRPAAAQANYESLQVGGRTGMMGGTAVAAGADQATVFLNPATITRIPDQSFSFSTFTAQVRNRSIEGALNPSGSLSLESPDVNQLKLRIQPNTFCLFLDGPPKDDYSGRSRHKFGMCVAATEREEMEFTKNNAGVNEAERAAIGSAYSTNYNWVRSTMALSWALQLDRDTSIGVTSRIDNARLNDQTSANIYAELGDLGGLRSMSHSIEAWSWDTSVVIGFTHFLSRRVTLGVALTTPSQHLFGRHVGMSSTSTTGEVSEIIQDNGDFRYNHPGSLRMGFAFTWPRLQLGLDASFYGPQRDIARANFDRTSATYSDAGEVVETARAEGTVERASVTDSGRPVTNLGVGLEYFLQPDVSLVTGVQTDFSGLHPRQDTEARDVLFRQTKDAVHAALGFTTYGEAGRLLMGVRGHYARGTALVADPSVPDPLFIALPQWEWGLNFVVSGSLTFTAVRQAADKAIAGPSPKKKSSEKTDEGEP